MARCRSVLDHVLPDFHPSALPWSRGGGYRSEHPIAPGNGSPGREVCVLKSTRPGHIQQYRNFFRISPNDRPLGAVKYLQSCLDCAIINENPAFLNLFHHLGARFKHLELSKPAVLSYSRFWQMPTKISTARAAHRNQGVDLAAAPQKDVAIDLDATSPVTITNLLNLTHTTHRATRSVFHDDLTEGARTD